MKHQAFFSELSNDELREKADEIYADLIDAANTCPNTGWHEACFVALHTACNEMVLRKMPPPTTATTTGILQ